MNAEMKHTPGPWGVEQTREVLWVGPMRPDGYKVSEIVVWLPYGDDYREEFDTRQTNNAHLIAAAPELLRALKEAAEIIENNTPFEADLAWAVIAKAEGR